MRKLFFAKGLFWVFYGYYNPDGIYYRTSSDGISWSGETLVTNLSRYGYIFSLFFDGTYVHYVSANGGNVYYRRGEPQNDGTISWSAVEQTAVSGGVNRYPSICVDSDGYAWIGYYVSNYPYVTKNANNDGTWTTDEAFPYQLSTTSGSIWWVIVVPLTSSKVYVVYALDFYSVYGQLYDGGWGSEETISELTLEYGYHASAINVGNDVHVSYIGNAATKYQIRYRKRTYGVGWGTDTLVHDNIPYVSPKYTSVLSEASLLGELRCFWMGDPTADHVYYKKMKNGIWDPSPSDWIDESTDDLKYFEQITAFFTDYGGKIGVAYLTKTASPYNVRFAFLEITELHLTVRRMRERNPTHRSSFHPALKL